MIQYYKLCLNISIKAAQEYSKFPTHIFHLSYSLSLSLTHSLTLHLTLFHFKLCCLYISLVLYLDGKEFDQKNSHIDLWWKSTEHTRKVKFLRLYEIFKGGIIYIKYIFISVSFFNGKNSMILPTKPTTKANLSLMKI